ncbi:MAG: PASTA domain-containing protein [Chloroflexi bacterium]|nr:PASTA domain-containing protein [Chloroflexota bacterium]
MKWTDRIARPKRDARDAAAAAASTERGDRAREMGHVLRDRRLALGLTLGEVEQTTRINRLYLEALEAARYDVIPAPVYARGFMRSYARHLGLDPEEAVQAIPSALPRPAGLEPMPGMRRTAPPTLPPLPALNATTIAGVVAVLLLVVIAVLVLPRLGGEGNDGLPTTTATGATGATGPTGATGTPGVPVVAPTVPPFDEGETPDFLGVTQAEAERVLTQIGATPLIVGAANAAPVGTVFGQQPDAGASLEPGDIVTLFISQGQ